MRLTIRTALWRSHVASVASSVDGLVPVVKGNGYGFGRRWLADTAAEFSDTIAVGTIHELDGLPDAVTPVVLTPTLTPPVASSAAPRSRPPILTVGNPAHIDALAGWNGRVLVKLASSMQRYGRTDAGDWSTTRRHAGLDVVGVSVHPPLAGTPADHAAEITTLVEGVDPSLPVWVSHLDPAAYAALPDHAHVPAAPRHAAVARRQVDAAADRRRARRRDRCAAAIASATGSASSTRTATW